jgi:hypothetical protein
LADDLNDLSVRYDAIFRFSQEVSAGRTAFETSHKKVLDCQKALDAEKSKESSKAYKLDLELAQLKDVRKRNKAGLDALLVQFIDSREKYAQFKIRRLRHGYQNVGEVAAMALEVEVHLLEQLERENSQAKETLDDYFVTPTE